MSCITSTITLQPGQTFVLPPGATIIGATDSTGLTSVNDCVDLTNLENFTCYGVTYGNAFKGGSESPVYLTVTINGIRLNDVDYPFISPINASTGTTDIIVALNETPYGTLFTNTASTSSSAVDRGIVRHLSFKTLPSIANDLYFYGIASGQVAAPSSGDFPVTFKVVPYDDFIAQGGTAPYPLCT